MELYLVIKADFAAFCCVLSAKKQQSEGKRWGEFWEVSMIKCQTDLRKITLWVWCTGVWGKQVSQVKRAFTGSESPSVVSGVQELRQHPPLDFWDKFSLANGIILLIICFCEWMYLKSHFHRKKVCVRKRFCLMLRSHWPCDACSCRVHTTWYLRRSRQMEEPRCEMSKRCKSGESPSRLFLSQLFPTIERLGVRILAGHQPQILVSPSWLIFKLLAPPV